MVLWCDGVVFMVMWACDGVVMWWCIGVVLSKSYCGVSVLVIVRSSPDRVVWCWGGVLVNWCGVDST